MTKPLNFELNEVVLCFHGPLIYEAKVLKSEYREDNGTANSGPFYLVHYKGWNDKWDEWVPETRLLKYSEENLAKQKSLTTIVHTNLKSSNASGSSQRKSMTGTDKKSKKKDGAPNNMDLQDEEGKIEVKLPIPDNLKVVLVDEWEAVTSEQKLVNLDASIKVVDVLVKFKEWIALNGLNKNPDIIDQICDGLREYFDLCLGSLLLYGFERLQYKNARAANPGKKMSEVYGSEHFLRLFTKLPLLIANTPTYETFLPTLKEYIMHFLKFLDEYHTTFFSLSNYIDAPPGYLSESKV